MRRKVIGHLHLMFLFLHTTFCYMSALFELNVVRIQNNSLIFRSILKHCLSYYWDALCMFGLLSLNSLHCFALMSFRRLERMLQKERSYTYITYECHPFTRQIDATHTHTKFNTISLSNCILKTHPIFFRLLFRVAFLWDLVFFITFAIQFIRKIKLMSYLYIILMLIQSSSFANDIQI